MNPSVYKPAYNLKKSKFNLSKLVFSIAQFYTMRSFFITLFILSLFASCNEEDHKMKITTVSDLEEVSGEYFKTSGSIKLKGADFQSDKMARSGNYSVQLDSLHKYALQGSVENIKIGDEIHLQIWRSGKGKENGEIILQIGSHVYLSATRAAKTEGDWDLLEFDFAIPMEFRGEGMKWYVTNTGSDEVFFDDFSIDIKRNNGLVIKTHSDLPKINLEIDAEDLEKIEEKRLFAIEKGVLLSSGDDYVKTKISWNGDKSKAKVRLKGDWTDHLFGQKFSLLVNVSKKETSGGYTKFGIQNPVSRHYLDEWFVHEILKKEGILTTRYEFVDLYINDENKGLYAVEEHFTPELLISQGRKNGAILKFSEDDVWNIRYINNKRDIPGVPVYQASIIDAFSQDDLMEDEDLRKNYFRGRDLMYQYQFKEDKASKIIDTKKMAAYIALMDLCNGYHSLIWHNQRFYYNEKEDRLEPLVYDIFQESSSLNEEQAFLFLGQQYVDNPNSYHTNTSDFIFQDSSFVASYLFYLNKFSAPDYFDNEYNDVEDQLKLYEKEIHSEYDFYSFDLDFYRKKAELIRAALPQFKIDIENLLAQDPKPHFGFIKVKEEYEAMENLSLHAYLNYVPGHTELQLQNFYFKELEVVGLVVDKEVKLLEQSVMLPAYVFSGPPTTITENINFIPQKVLFKYNGSDSLYTQKVIPYRAPLEKTDEKKANR